MFPVDKQDVLDWWEDQEFDLGIEEHDGNCKGCYKKSYNKLYKQLDNDSHILDWHVSMEDKYKSIKGNMDRVFFRGNKSAEQVIQEWKIDRETGAFNPTFDKYSDGGCSESCEVFTTS